MKLKATVSKILTNKWVLNIVAIISLLNVIGYMVMGKFNHVLIFAILAILVRYFSKNMIIVLGVPLIVVNLFAAKNLSYYGIEGMETPDPDTIKKINDKTKKDDQTVLPGTEAQDESTNSNDVAASNIKMDEHFEVGRPKHGGSKIDYAATVESAYDDLNKILGSDGIKNLTDDTQRLMKQQMELAKSMEGLTPLMDKLMPMANQMQDMMKNMNTGSGGMSNIMDMAKQMSQGLNK